LTRWAHPGPELAHGAVLAVSATGLAAAVAGATSADTDAGAITLELFLVASLGLLRPSRWAAGSIGRSRRSESATSS
jgi:hypothetical protein